MYNQDSGRIVKQIPTLATGVPRLGFLIANRHWGRIKVLSKLCYSFDAFHILSLRWLPTDVTIIAKIAKNRRRSL